VDRKKLADLVLGKDKQKMLAGLEEAVHPLVEEARNSFIKQVMLRTPCIMLTGFPPLLSVKL
jgi:hypothetical protein